MSNSLLLVISLLPGLTLKERLLLLELFPDFTVFSALNSQDISSILGRKINTKTFAMQDLLKKADKINVLLNTEGIEIIPYWDREYPSQLREIYDPPFLLYVRGGKLPHTFPSVAVVGTRHPTSEGRQSAFLMGKGFAERSIPVVSGLALGIDAAVHKGVVNSRGKTIAVLGNGIDSVYPSLHKTLANDIIANGGVIVSEFPPGTPPLKYNFPKRNRIISGLSRAVVIVEAPEKSGALITADYALDQGKDLFVHSCSFRGTRGEGARRLALDGAFVLDSAEDLICFLDKQHDGPSLTELEEPEQWGLANLLEAELNGALFQHEGHYFIRGGKAG